MDTNRFLLRPFQPEDFTVDCPITVNAWAGIFDGYHKQLGNEIYDYFYTYWRDAKFYEFGTSMKKNAESGLAFTIIDTTDGSVAAMGSCIIENEIGIVVSNASRSDLRGMGIGAALHRHMINVFRDRGLKYAQVCTGADDAHAPARRSYERSGFGHPVTFSTYFRKNSDAPAAFDFSLPEGITFRAPEESEYEAVFELVKDSFQPNRTHMLEVLGEDFAHFPDVYLQKKLKNTSDCLCSPQSYNRFCMYVDGELAGFCSWQPTELKTGIYGYINICAAASKFQGREQELIMHNFLLQDMLKNNVPFSKYTPGCYDMFSPDPSIYEKAGFNHSTSSVRYHTLLDTF